MHNKLKNYIQHIFVNNNSVRCEHNKNKFNCFNKKDFKLFLEIKFPSSLAEL